MLVVVAGLCVWPNFNRTRAEDDKSELGKFMRRKLDASSKILEGLTTEDSKLVVEGANILLELSKAEKWQILKDAEYREFSSEFRRDAKMLADAAEKNNFDNAMLQWMDTMKGCVECHKHVRSARQGK